MASDRKNRTPKIGPTTSGICEMTDGKATKARPMPPETTSPTPTPAWVAMKPRVAKTPMPARTSKEELAKAVTSAELVRLERGFR